MRRHAGRCRPVAVSCKRVLQKEKGEELGCAEAWVATELNDGPARALYEALGGVPDPEQSIR